MTPRVVVMKRENEMRDKCSATDGPGQPHPFHRPRSGEDDAPDRVSDKRNPDRAAS